MGENGRRDGGHRACDDGRDRDRVRCRESELDHGYVSTLYRDSDPELLPVEGSQILVEF